MASGSDHETLNDVVPALSRRGFLQGIGATAIAAGLASGNAAAETSSAAGTLPETLTVLGAKMELLLDASATGGRLAVLVETTPPGGGPPLHSHANEDEYFYVLNGEFEFTLADEQFRPKPGEFVTIPRGIPHRFQNVGAEPGQLHITLSPAGFEEFFRQVSAVFGDGPPRFRPADRDRSSSRAHVAHRVGVRGGLTQRPAGSTVLLR